MDSNIEEISCGDSILAYVVRSNSISMLASTLFVTPIDSILQVGISVHKAGSEILRHEHLSVLRNIVGTPEVVFVKNGKCEVSIYNFQRVLVATKVLNTGDIIILLAGGHGFRMFEDTNLFEVKQGPFVGDKDKERW